MIKVYVWPPAGGNVGHAAAQVGPSYISWWPDSPIEVGLPSVDFNKTSPKSSTYSPGRWRVESSPIRRRRLEDDERDEGGKAPTSTTTIINGLDESAILNWWAGFGLQRGSDDLQGPLPKYHLLSQSCSTVVARALRIGGGDEYSGWWNRNNTIWTPMDVHRYAHEIAQTIKSQK